MNKIAVIVVFSVLLLVNGFGGTTNPTAWADSSEVKVVLNGQVLKSDLYTAYSNGTTVMIPLREASSVLKYQTAYQKSTETITLIGAKQKIEYKVGDNYITINGKEKRVFKDEVVFKKEHLYVPLSFFTSAGLVTAYKADANLVEVYAPEVTASVIAGLLSTGQFQELENRFFSDEMKRSLSVTGLQKYWADFTARAGTYHGIKSTESSQKEDQMLIQCVLGFAVTEASLEFVLDKSGKIVELKGNLPSI